MTVPLAKVRLMRKWLTNIICILLGSCFVGCAGYYYNQARNQDTIEAYDIFLTKYKSGEFTDKALARKDTLVTIKEVKKLVFENKVKEAIAKYGTNAIPGLLQSSILAPVSTKEEIRQALISLGDAGIEQLKLSLGGDPSAIGMALKVIADVQGSKDVELYRSFIESEHVAIRDAAAWGLIKADETEFLLRKLRNRLILDKDLLEAFEDKVSAPIHTLVTEFIGTQTELDLKTITEWSKAWAAAGYYLEAYILPYKIAEKLRLTAAKATGGTGSGMTVEVRTHFSLANSIFTDLMKEISSEGTNAIQAINSIVEIDHVFGLGENQAKVLEVLNKATASDNAEIRETAAKILKKIE